MHRAQDIISGRDVAVKLEPHSSCTQNPSSLVHEYYVLKKLQGGIGVLQPLFFGRESSYNVLVLNNVATPICDMLNSQPGGHLKSNIVADMGYQLVSI